MANKDLILSYSTIDNRNDPATSVGSLNIVCQYCSTLKWKDESKGICCSNGEIKRDDIIVSPDPLKSLTDGNHPKHTEFIRNIRLYNNTFQMTSFKSQRVVEHGFMPTFTVQGQVYHLAGSLLPYRPDDHKFLHIYFIADPEIQTAPRCNIKKYQ